MSEKLGFRAHARLLTMLGEQLIKNERVALVELVKNAYDADATRVLVDFLGFTEDFKPGPSASIVITDNGVGMTEELVRTAWMNPATLRTISEATKILIAALPETPDNLAAINRIRSAYQVRFHQQLVGMTIERACAVF